MGRKRSLIKVGETESADALNTVPVVAFQAVLTLFASIFDVSKSNSVAAATLMRPYITIT